MLYIWQQLVYWTLVAKLSQVNGRMFNTFHHERCYDQILSFCREKVTTLNFFSRNNYKAKTITSDRNDAIRNKISRAISEKNRQYRDNYKTVNHFSGD